MTATAYSRHGAAITPATIDRIQDLIEALQVELSRPAGRAGATRLLAGARPSDAWSDRVTRRLIGLGRASGRAIRDGVIDLMPVPPTPGRAVPEPVLVATPTHAPAPGRTTARVLPGSLRRVPLPDPMPARRGAVPRRLRAHAGT
ncbi:MAG TPA: hypothetical protein VHL09_04475 [Dehalococcoidia bacterium]|nr:hypothetical protein [Dehalococcoidia bacterium]